MDTRIKALKKVTTDYERLLVNINKIHTTKMGIERIKKNLELKNDNVIEYLKDIIQNNGCNIWKRKELVL